MNIGSGLCCQVKELEEEVRRLHTIRDDKKEPENPASLREGQEGSVLIRLGNGDSERGLKFDGSCSSTE